MERGRGGLVFCSEKLLTHSNADVKIVEKSVNTKPRRRGSLISAPKKKNWCCSLPLERTLPCVPANSDPAHAAATNYYGTMVYPRIFFGGGAVLLFPTMVWTLEIP